MFLLDPEIFLWDLAILLMLAFGMIVSILSFRRGKWWIVLGTISLACVLIVAYGSFVEPQTITVSHHTVALPIQDKLRIVVISDFQVGPYKTARFVKRVVQQTNGMYPDLVLLVGDFVNSNTSNVSDLLPLGDLRATLGVFAVLGNHDIGKHLSLLRKPVVSEDRGTEVARFLRELDITVLENEHSFVTLPHGQLAIAGITDVWSENSDVTRALRGILPSTLTILLSHNPDIVLQEESFAADLIVSGHTHGGQIRLPFFGPVRSVPTQLGDAFSQGLFTVETGLRTTQQLAITRGVGESLTRARLLAWPEILVLDVE
ncbi:hypothetical protein COU77_03440 [Candidatus Peregrinibacteria bacterium CG10_big_fil_rev_8_21_14_0_10_49_16]|nr:MAG: hypothetical protein COW95_02850 [Candidatus Peregrinibacteria bacterium CG22_combo_CG10-13_8_21_14_all_49_11]PIR51864.1 MAG: hypothetical protein COU77_03440 [Candidatus Peregrinibacteria bacterium CG10_big_fil_rev_8_21_14_0_10_49_16]